MEKRFSQPPQVAVIILNYNGREHLDLCLSSLADLCFDQDLLDIIVVDNGSTDGSPQFIASQYPQVRLVVNPTNLGFSQGANIGASASTASYLAFLNNDMRVDGEWLKGLVDAVQPHDVACAGSVVMNWEGDAIDFAGRPDDAFCLTYGPAASWLRASVPDSNQNTFFVSGGAFLIKADAFEELGGFEPDFFLYQDDVDLCWRAWLRGYRCVLVPTSKVYHRGGASSRKLPSEYVQFLSLKHALCTLFKNAERPVLTSALPRLLRFLLHRRLHLPYRGDYVGEAVREFKNSLPDWTDKRREVQLTRVRNDEEIFSLTGDPLGFLNLSEYQMSDFETMTRGTEDSMPDPYNLGEMSEAIVQWMDKARWLDESALEARLAEQTNLASVLSSRAADAEALLARAESRRADAEVRATDAEARATDAGIRLAVAKDELQRVHSSLGWRILSRYGRVKYRYLLPLLDQFRGGRAQGNDAATKGGKYASRFKAMKFHSGDCNICGSRDVRFFYESEALYRESLTCGECLSTSRYRSIARGLLVALQEMTGIKATSLADLVKRSAAASLKIYDTQIPFYFHRNSYPIPDILARSNWLEVHTSTLRPDLPLGASIGDKRTNQNLESLTFEDAIFDIVITSDVMEHVRLDDLAHAEIRRVLRPGGAYLFTAPHFRNRRETFQRVSVTNPSDSSQDVYVVEKEYHGDANSTRGGALSYRAYGTDLDEKLAALGFDVDYTNRDFPELGIMNTELFFCRLRP